ncbi:MAG: biotin/lipoyl-containing protein [Bacteroidota bacterium]|nr:biotin/lipoyl-containing protein [Bacteroidota bacterium]
MKKFKLKIGENAYDVDIVSVEENSAHVLVNGKEYEVEVDKKLQPTKTPVLVRSKVEPSTESDRTLVKTNQPGQPKGTGFIKSPLPGTILSVCVKVGDRVKIGDRLIILEAMKMENNINSDRAGTITAIKVNAKDAVLEGDILIEVGA